MKKTAYDLYNCKNNNLDNCLQVYSLNEDIAKELEIKPVYKPIIVPYFYGKVKEDEGISCLNIFEDRNGFLGFFTLHTFSQRKIAYFDSFSNAEIKKAGGGFEDFLKEKLLSEEVLKPSKVNQSQIFFGKQIRLEMKGAFCIEQFYDLNAKIVEKLEMTQIFSPVLEKNERSICMLSLIAESHIGFIYDIKGKILNLDIFSCKNFDEKIILELLNSVGSVVDYKVSIRGIKHNNFLNKQTDPVLELKSTPKKDGFSLLSNFDHGDCVYYLWPERSDVWLNGGKDAQDVVTGVLNQIIKYDKVIIGVNDIKKFKEQNFNINKNIQIEQISYNDAWIRDTGPTIISNEKRQFRAVNFGFNGYGGKLEGLYFPFDLDLKLAERLCEKHNVSFYPVPNFILEGGSICSNGKGTVIAIEKCVLNPNRNPKFSKKQAENIFADYFGTKKVIWIEEGLKFDETGGHIDNVCSFINENTVAVACESNKKDAQYDILHKIYKKLNSETTYDGKPLKIVKIHQPHCAPITKTEASQIVSNKDVKTRLEGDEVVGSYINAFISDKYIVVPQFGSKVDDEAVETYKKLFTNKKIIKFNARPLVISGGGIHCVLKKL